MAVVSGSRALARSIQRPAVAAFRIVIERWIIIA